MRRWIGIAAGLALIIVIVASAIQAISVTAQETLTSIKPGGLYTAEVTVEKPAEMNLTANWEIRFYVFKSDYPTSDVTSCFNTGKWWDTSKTGVGPYLYTGYWDHRVEDQSWKTSDPNVKSWSTSVQLVNYPRGFEGPAYPYETFENKMGELPIGDTVTLRARLLFRNLTPKFEGEYVAFKIAGKDYRYKFQKDSYDRYWLKTLDGEDVGTGAYIDMSEGTKEWRLNYRSDVVLLVDNNAPATGKIVVPNSIIIGLEVVAGFDVLLLAGIGAVVVVIAVVVIVLTRKRGGSAGGAPPLPVPPTVSSC